MNRFKTLMLREWMQHQRGWLILMALPLLLFAAGGMFGEVQLGKVKTSALAQTLVLTGVVTVTTFVLAWGAQLVMSPGLARRDIQDRSIEFWLSLPAGHAQSLGATLLMHLLIVPCAAIGVGLAGGLLISAPVVIRAFDAGAWFALPWATLLAAAALLVLRLALGLLLATLWLSPLILGTMAASAWLKRWGVAAVAGVVGAGGLLLDRVYGNPVVWDVLQSLVDHAGRALIAADRSGGGPKGLVINTGDDVDFALSMIPSWLLHDAGQALAMLASPTFIAAIAAGGAAFALLVLRRQRGA